jgi:hypothetical protein
MYYTLQVETVRKHNGNGPPILAGEIPTPTSPTPLRRGGGGCGEGWGPSRIRGMMKAGSPSSPSASARKNLPVKGPLRRPRPQLCPHQREPENKQRGEKHAVFFTSLFLNYFPRARFQRLYITSSPQLRNPAVVSPCTIITASSVRGVGCNR